MGRPKRTADQIKNPVKRQEYLAKKAFVPLDEYSNATLDSIVPINRTLAHWERRDFSNLLPGQSGKPSFTRQDYDAFRPESLKPKKYPEIIDRCNAIYRSVGLIRNIIDLMGDFTVQGIRLVHPNKRIEQFHQNLWELWNGTGVSERISNTLYRLANVPIQFYTMKLKPTEIEKLYRSTAEPDNGGLPSKLPNFEARELPYKFVVLDPACVVAIGGPLASFVDTPQYGLLLPTSLKTRIVNPNTDAEKSIVAKLPPELINAAKTNTPYPLPPDKTTMLYYKKDDWAAFADPMIYSIMDDIEVLMKLKLADLCALDGATSKIRIFKLGDVEHKIAPSPDMAEKLSQILQNNVGSSVTDIVWGPDIDILETSSDTYQFLGEPKYSGTLNNIYAGMGIPPTLTGTFGAAGTTNNFISLKTLTERLEYGRSILIDFWSKQLKIVQKQMGFRFPAKVVFDQMILGDESAEKALLIQLADRNLMSDEMIQYAFKGDPELERIRQKREAKEREGGSRVPKAGPWYNEPDPQLKLRQIALQTGQATPSELGLDLLDKKPGEKAMLDKQHALEKEKIAAKGPTLSLKKKPKGRPGQGRPKTSKDKQKRKARKFTARSMVETWARKAQATIAEVLTPAILGTFDKKNLRQLTAEQANHSEMVKFAVLTNLQPYSDLSEAGVLSSLEKPLSSQAKAWYDNLVVMFKDKYGREPTFDEGRDLQVNVYSYMYKGFENGQS